MSGNGRMGLAPAAIELGDEVVLLQSCDLSSDTSVVSGCL